MDPQSRVEGAGIANHLAPRRLNPLSVDLSKEDEELHDGNEVQRMHSQLLLEQVVRSLSQLSDGAPSEDEISPSTWHSLVALAALT